MQVAVKRIAKGSGTTVQEVNRLLKAIRRYEKNDETNDWYAAKRKEKRRI